MERIAHLLFILLLPIISYSNDNNSTLNGHANYKNLLQQNKLSVTNNFPHEPNTNCDKNVFWYDIESAPPDEMKNSLLMNIHNTLYYSYTSQETIYNTDGMKKLADYTNEPTLDIYYHLTKASYFQINKQWRNASESIDEALRLLDCYESKYFKENQDEITNYLLLFAKIQRLRISTNLEKENRNLAHLDVFSKKVLHKNTIVYSLELTKKYGYDKNQITELLKKYPTNPDIPVSEITQYTNWLIEKGNWHYINKSYPVAQLFGIRARDIAHVKKLPEITLQSYNLLSKANYSLGKEKLAYKYEESFNFLKDNLISQGITQDSIKNKRVLVELENDYQYSKLVTSFLTVTNTIIFVFLIIFIIGFKISFNLWSRVKMLNEIILHYDDNTYEILNSYINRIEDVVKVVRTNGKTINPIDALAYIRQLRIKVEAVQDLQSMLLDDLKNSKPKKIGDLIKKIALSECKLHGYSPKTLITKGLKANRHVTINAAKDLGTVVQEIISNSFQHGLANVKNPKIKLSTKVEKQMFILSIQDNGSGIKHNNFAPGVGTRLTNRIIVRGYEGEIKRRNLTNGHEVVVTIPFKNLKSLIKTPRVAA